MNFDGLSCLVLVVPVGLLAANLELSQKTCRLDSQTQEHTFDDAAVVFFCAKNVCQHGAEILLSLT